MRQKKNTTRQARLRRPLSNTHKNPDGLMRKISAACVVGEVFGLTYESPEDGTIWGSTKTVSAEFIEGLISGEDSKSPTFSIRLGDLRITGQLDFRNKKINFPIEFYDCWFDEAPILDGATLKSISFAGSRVPGLFAIEMNVEGNFELSQGFTSHGPVEISGSRISGELNLVGAILCPTSNEVALEGFGATIQGDLRGHQLLSLGPISLIRSHVGGHFGMDLATIKSPLRQGLSIRDARINGAVLCRQSKIFGTFDAGNAAIGSVLALIDATVHNPAQVAVELSNSQIGSLDASRAVVHGEVRLVDSKIDGSILLNTSILHNPSGKSFNGNRVSVRGSLLARESAQSFGEFNLLGASIGGAVEFDGATLDNPEAKTFHAEMSSIKGALFMRSSFSSTGLIDIRFAEIASIEITDAKLQSSNVALAADGATVKQRFLFSRSACTGTINLAHSTTAKVVSFTGARLESAGYCLNMTGAAAGRLNLLFEAAPVGPVLLVDAKIGTLTDDPATWAEEGMLDLSGCVYDSLISLPDKKILPSKTRIEWVERSSRSRPGSRSWYAMLAPSRISTNPQPLEQLASVYKSHGHDRDARATLLARERARRRTLGVFGKTIGVMQDLLLGYGYRPSRAFYSLSIFWVLGTIYFTFYSSPRQVKPGEGPQWMSWAYSLDLLLPIVNLGQESAWRPDGAGLYVAYGLIAFGWVMATAVIAGFTRIFSRS